MAVFLSCAAVASRLRCYVSLFFRLCFVVARLEAPLPPPKVSQSSRFAHVLLPPRPSVLPFITPARALLSFLLFLFRFFVMCTCFSSFLFLVLCCFDSCCLCSWLFVRRCLFFCCWFLRVVVCFRVVLANGPGRAKQTTRKRRKEAIGETGNKCTDGWMDERRYAAQGKRYICQCEGVTLSMQDVLLSVEGVML